MSLLTIVQAVATAATVVLVLIAIAVVDRLYAADEPVPETPPQGGR